MIKEKIGFIGFGKMAEALALGFVSSQLSQRQNIYFTEKNESRAQTATENFGFKSVHLKKIINETDIVFIAIKPQGIQNLLPQLKEGPLYVSILAGTPISSFERAIPNIKLIRIMPNTPVLVGKGMFGLSKNNQVSNDELEQLSGLLKSTGKVIVTEEKNLDAITGISGSGPAFMYHIAKSIIDVGLKAGLSEKEARLLVSQTMLGASKMISKTDKPLTELIADVRSPNGTTHAGLCVLENSNFDEILQNCIQSAITRSIELGRE